MVVWDLLILAQEEMYMQIVGNAHIYKLFDSKSCACSMTENINARPTDMPSYTIGFDAPNQLPIK